MRVVDACFGLPLFDFYLNASVSTLSLGARQKLQCGLIVAVGDDLRIINWDALQRRLTLQQPEA